MGKLPPGTSHGWGSFTLSDVRPQKLVWEHFGVYWCFVAPSKTRQCSSASYTSSEGAWRVSGLFFTVSDQMPSPGYGGRGFFHVSQMCKGEYWHDTKHYSTNQDLLLISIFPYLAQNFGLLLNKCCLVVIILRWMLNSSAPGLFLCRSEFLPSHIQKLSSSPTSVGGCKPGLSKAPAALAVSQFLIGLCWGRRWKNTLFDYSNSAP